MSEEHPELLARLVDLESRIAFMERTLIEMSDALADARMESVRDRVRMQGLLTELGELRGMIPGDDPHDEPPPPHY
ncbi:MAG: SlyX family protein [Proteobacteria bacterium]|nr:SlyX family protein [Pseudomonadota bacterium]